ncbi:unnamed protein product [Euphydryas editha]|uniref:Protein lethal(2)denticleless n=1 Tax=Euphydryas editha TaxID=104508 RepID=A0AAU9VBJ9_EUPED|nr:unnamed protein product [Euphydryas editha]
MNEVQNIIDRQLGIYTRFNYDNVLKRLSVHSDESFYGLQNNILAADFDQDPPIFACRFSEAPGYEHILALANEDGRVAIQDTRTMETAKKLEGFQCHNNAVFDLAWMPQYMKFVTVSGDHTACLWDVSEAGPRREAVFTGHTRSVKTAAFQRLEPRVFATGARDGRVLLWDARAAARPHLALDGCHAAASPRPAARRPARAAPRRAARSPSPASCSATTSRSSRAASATAPSSSARNGYTNLIIDDARVRLYASCMDDVIYCFNVSTFNSLPEQRYVGHENSTFYIKTGLSPDGAYLVSGSSDKNAYVWNVKYSQPVVRLCGHRAEVTCAAWCPRGDAKIVTCSDDARHMIWRIGREFPKPEAEPRGRAEVTPRADASHALRWGAPERTPSSLKRRASATPGSCGAKRARADRPAARTKRCLADLMNSDAVAAKRLRLAAPVPEENDPTDPPPGSKRPSIPPGHSTPPPGSKRPSTPPGDSTPPPGSKRPSIPPGHSTPPPGSKRPSTPPGDSTPPKRKCTESNPPTPDGWTYFSPKAGTSFMTPTKNYEKKNCKILSPRSPKTLSPSDINNRTPVKTSPTKVKIIRFTTPTKDLPNFVLTGEAPHLRLMSPIRKKQETTDWLTLIVREKKGKSTEGNDKTNVILSSPKESVPTRRNSATDKTPKSSSKNRSILKYFSVAKKD